MAVSKLDTTFPSFYDLNGNALENGNIFIGTKDKNAETNMISVFLDKDLTIPIAQPLTTNGGYIVSNGTPVNIFVNTDYSITVKDKNNIIVYIDLNVIQAADAAAVSANTANIVINTDDIATNTTAIGLNTNNRLNVVFDIILDANYTLTPEQNQFGRIEITDTNTFLTTTREIIMNNDEHTFLFVNSTAQSLTVKTSAGTGIAVASLASVELRNDTVDVIEFEAVISLLGTLDFNNMIHIQDQRPSGTDAGGLTGGVDTTVTLNTILTNTGNFGSLLSNVFSLDKGSYYIEANVPAFRVNRHKSKLVNNSDAIDEIIGSSEFCPSTENSQTQSFIYGRLEVSATKNFELQHRCQTTKSVDGSGASSGFGEFEVYADIKIWKVG